MSDKVCSPILQYAIDNGASDIHMCESEPIGFRVNWRLWRQEAAVLDSEKMNKIVLELYWWDQAAVDRFKEHKDDDLAYVHSDGTPFRINAFYKMGKMALVMRIIAAEPKRMEDLWLPEWAKKFTKAMQWLILVTWPTWSWKSTSMISIMEEINQTRREHVITLEDPIEFIFKDWQSIFSQRHIWKDTDSFTNALRWAMRQDPDIVVVWEMRDQETVEAALELAETGHLVVSTLHTAWSVATITRLINFFNPDIQHAIRYKLADTLFGVLSQRLIPKAQWDGRVWIYEIMFMTPGIKNLIRAWDLAQVPNQIEMWQSEWMCTMKWYADKIAAQWIVKEEDYINFFLEDMDD